MFRAPASAGRRRSSAHVPAGRVPVYKPRPPRGSPVGTRAPADWPTSGWKSNGADRSRSEAERAQRERPREEATGRSDARSDDTGAQRGPAPGGRRGSETPSSLPKYGTSSQLSTTPLQERRDGQSDADDRDDRTDPDVEDPVPAAREERRLGAVGDEEDVRIRVAVVGLGDDLEIGRASCRERVLRLV